MNAKEGSRPGSAHVVELDGVRGMAACLVVYMHIFLMRVPAKPVAVFWLRTLSGMAWTGVHLFFILSGYLIGGILLRNCTSETYWSTFYVRRCLRILPLYFVVLAVFFALRRFTWLGETPVFSFEGIPPWNYPLLVQNFTMAATASWGPPVLAVTWSVAVEEQFYLLLPLLIRVVPPRWHRAMFIAGMCVGPLCRHFVPVPLASLLLPGVAESLFGGVLLAWASIHAPSVFSTRKWRVRAIAGFAVGGCAMGLIAVGKLHAGAMEVSIITLFWGTFLWLVLCHLGTRLVAPLRWQALQFVGAISYGVYLFHFFMHCVFFYVVTGHMATLTLGPAGLAIASAGFGLTLLAAAISYYGVERRLIAWGRHFSYRRSA